MKFIKQYIEEKCFLHPMGEVTLQESEDAAGWSGVNICINGVETALFISHAEYAEWVESKLDALKDKKDEQTEQNPEEKHEKNLTDKVAPRFNAGDWVVQGKNIYKIEKVTNLPGNYFQYWTNDEAWFGDGTDAHLWTIDDAKDGDVLVTTNKNIFIFKDIKGAAIYDYCGLFFGEFKSVSNCVNGTISVRLPNDYLPATKEQRELLFAKIKEYGYEWDSDNKKLNEIEQKSLERSEDERIRKELIAYLDVQDAITDRKDQDFKHWIDWLEKQDSQMIARGERKNLALSLMDYLDNNRVEGCMDLSSMECEDLENAVVNSDWGKVYHYMRKKLEKQDKQNSNYYIHITQGIIDYINKHKAKFENDNPKLGDVWRVKEIHTRPGNPIVELENDKGAWMNLPLHVVDIDFITFDPSSDWKPTDNVKPKIKVGDWVVQRDLSDFYSGDKFAQITNIDDEGNYWLDCGTWITGREIRLWTIYDAKDGDVLVSPYQRGIEDKEEIFIFKCIGNRGYIDNCIEYYCNVNEGEFYVNKTSYMDTTSFPLYPATEKQRDLLFAKMKKAGYQWDNEKKQILRIDNSINTIEK